MPVPRRDAGRAPRKQTRACVSAIKCSEHVRADGGEGVNGGRGGPGGITLTREAHETDKHPDTEAPSKETTTSEDTHTGAHTGTQGRERGRVSTNKRGDCSPARDITRQHTVRPSARAERRSEAARRGNGRMGEGGEDGETRRTPKLRTHTHRGMIPSNKGGKEE